MSDYRGLVGCIELYLGNGSLDIDSYMSDYEDEVGRIVIESLDKEDKPENIQVFINFKSIETLDKFIDFLQQTRSRFDSNRNDFTGVYTVHMVL